MHRKLNTWHSRQARSLPSPRRSPSRSPTAARSTSASATRAARPRPRRRRRSWRTSATTGSRRASRTTRRAAARPATAATTTGLQEVNACANYVNRGLGPAAAFRTRGTVPFVIRDTNRGRVANLNADLLDDKQATDFLGKTEKAADADKLDGLDAGAGRPGAVRERRHERAVAPTLGSQERRHRGDPRRRPATTASTSATAT